MLNKKQFAGLWPCFFCCLLLLLFLSSSMGTIFTTEAANEKSTLNINVEATALHFRTGPALSHSSLQTLPRGTPLQVLFHEKENWLLVRLENGRTGWVDGQHTSFSPAAADRLSPVIGEKVLVKLENPNSSLNVRTGPGLSYQKIEQLRNKSEVTVYFQEGDWLLARLDNGTSGWLHIRYTTYVPQKSGNLELENGAQSSPEQTANANTGKENEGNVAKPDEFEKNTGEPEKKEGKEEGTRQPYQVSISEKSLTLREEPRLDGAPITLLDRGTVLTVQQKTEDDWLQVTMEDGRGGWVAGWCTQLHAGQEWGSTPGNNFRLATVNADVLRVRSGPGLQYSQIGRISSGNHVLTLKEQNGWYYVRVPDGNQGWICGDYATIRNIASRGEVGTGKSLTQAVTIVLDPGHGGYDCGATGHSGLKEKDVNLTVALHLANLLRTKGFNVVLTREKDKYITLEERVALAGRAGADLFISVHANASSNNKFASGTETYYFPNKDSSPQSFFLASLVQQEVPAALNLPGIGVKKASFHVLRETNMPAILVELAFLSNAVDETILRSEECLRSAADAIYRAVLQYYNLI